MVNKCSILGCYTDYTDYYKVSVLTLFSLNFVFGRFLRCNPICAPIVYRLVGAALIGIFSIILSYFEIEILTLCT